jgi:uncharacterized cupin superfamily protein
VRRFNVLAPQAGQARVGEALGAEQMGASLYELGDDQRGAAYHFHHGREEWLIVLAGAPTVRTPGGEQALRAGDTLCFPAGPAGAHEVTGPGTILVLSETTEPDLVEQPEEGTLEMRPAGRVFRTDA